MTLEIEMPVSYGQYNITDDSATMPDQGAWPGPVPAMVVRDGSVIVYCCTHDGPIWLEYGADPPPDDEDLSAWEVVVHLDVHAEGGLKVRPWGDAPKLEPSKAQQTGNYRLRLYASDVAATDRAGRGAGESLVEPIERHRLLIGSVGQLEPPRELKRSVLA